MSVRTLLLSAALLSLAACHDFDGELAACIESGHCLAEDRVTPTLVASTPVAQAAGVGPGAAIVLGFSETMDTGSVTARLAPPVALTNPTWDEEGKVVSFTPLSPLAHSTAYVLTVEGKDLSGNALAAVQLSFTTRGPPDEVPPTLASSLPANDTVGVAVASTLSLKFSEPMNPALLTVTAEPAQELGEAVWSEGNSRATFTPAEPWAPGTLYTVSVSAGDAEGNPLVGVPRVRFTTAAPPDAVRPTVAGTTPTAGSSTFPAAANLTFTFSEPMSPSTMSSLVALSPSVPCVLTWSNENTLLTCDPTSPLAGDTQYTVTLSSALADAAGNTLGANHVFSFRTAAEADVTRPTITTATPAHGSIGAAQRPTFVVTFSEPMNRADTQAALQVTSPAGLAFTYAWSADSTTLYAAPTSDIPHGRQVDWQVGSGAKDLSGNTLVTRLFGFRVVRLGTVTLTSAAALDGYGVRASKGSVSMFTSGSYGYAGDSTDVSTYRSFFSFDLSGLEPTLSRITSATLYVTADYVVGVPAATRLYATSVHYGTTLEAADYDLPTQPSCDFRCKPYSYDMGPGNVTGERSAAVTTAVAYDWSQRGDKARSARTQFRLMQSPEVTVNGASDYLRLYTGEGTLPPRLTVAYEYP